METPHSELQNALRRAVRLDAEELAFFSGVDAYITTAAGQQSLPMSQQLSAEHVRQLHVACLAVAGRDGLKWLHFVEEVESLVDADSSDDKSRDTAARPGRFKGIS